MITPSVYSDTMAIWEQVQYFEGCFQEIVGFYLFPVVCSPDGKGKIYSGRMCTLLIVNGIANVNGFRFLCILPLKVFQNRVGMGLWARAVVHANNRAKEMFQPESSKISTKFPPAFGCDDSQDVSPFF